MKLSRFNALFNGLNGTAKKVYEAVPMTTHWTQFKIMKELERTGKHLDPAAVKGCLGYMLSVGIVEQNKDQEFMRTSIKATKAFNDEPDDIPTTIPTEEETKMATTPVTTDKPTPPTVFEILAKLAERAQSIADEADDLRDDIEKAALQAQAEQDRLNAVSQKDAEELAKLRQLKALLAGLKD